MTPPLVVVERHRNRKSVPDCDAFPKNAERCKNLTCFALRGTKAAPPYRSDALAYRSGSAASAARSCPRPNEEQSRDIFASLIRAFQSRRRPKMFAAFSVNVVRRSDVNVTHARKKSPRPRSGAQYYRPSLPLIWLAALAWTALLATLPGLLLLL